MSQSQDPRNSPNALPCIICRKPLEKVSRDATNHPDDGVVCTTHGNYGSTVFDPGDGSYLEFNMCDQCLLNAARFNCVAIVRPYVSRRKGPEPLRMWSGKE